MHFRLHSIARWKRAKSLHKIQRLLRLWISDRTWYLPGFHFEREVECKLERVWRFEERIFWRDRILFGYEDTWWNSPRDLLNWFGLGNLFNWENSKNELEIERFSLKWGKFENRKSPEWLLSNEADVEKLIVHVHYFVGLYFIKLV